MSVHPVLRASAAHVFVDDLAAPVLDDGDRHHLERVLRIGAGDSITVSDGRGRWSAARLAAGEVVLDGDLHSVDVAPDSAVWSAVPKGDRPEWVVQKLTELGVGTIGFVECARSVVRWDAARAARQLERWQRVAREASMQSRRVWLPHVVGVRPFAALDLSTIALADPDGDDGLQGCRGVVVGPEGGFTPAELAAATRCVSLGDTVLRVETAAVVAGVLLTRH